jgi:hypothetical protein
MAINWWNIEENQDIIEVTIEEAIDEIDGEYRGTAAMASSNDGNDLEREEEVDGDDPAHPLLSHHNA